MTEYDEGEDHDSARWPACERVSPPQSIVGSGRVAKYAQRFTEKLNLGRRETAILCVLMLRGQQTPGEIKGRTERIYAFTDLDETGDGLAEDDRAARIGSEVGCGTGHERSCVSRRRSAELSSNPSPNRAWRVSQTASPHWNLRLRSRLREEVAENCAAALTKSCLGQAVPPVQFLLPTKGRMQPGMAAPQDADWSAGASCRRCVLD